MAAASGFTLPAVQKTNFVFPPSDEQLRWVDSIMSQLSLRQRVAQLFVPRLDIFDNAAGRVQLRKMVADEGVGGFLLGKGSINGYASLINFAQKEAKIPLMVTLDGEWGLSMRVEDSPRFPYNMGLGAIQDERLLYDYGREVARECREMGIHVDFAPVLDVNSNPANPVIGYRSFGEDPARVAALGTAYSKGLESGGVMAVGKHFPGHGDTSSDSHKVLPVVNHSMEHLEEVDLFPFKKFIDAKLSGVMVGHLNVPAIDASGKPASLSHKITTGLLREKMGFGGMIFTDALAMKGATGKENNCVAALMAGADVLLASAAPSTDIDAVVNAVKSGKIDEKTINERCRKMLSTKYSLGLANYVPVNFDGLADRINSAEADAVNDKLAAASITVVRNEKYVLPIGNLGRNDICVVSIGAPVENLFSEYCGKYAKVDCFSVTSAGISQATLAKVRKADVLIIGVFSDAQWARDAFAKLAGDSAHEVVPVFFMNPYKMGKFSASLSALPALVAAYDDTPALRRNAAQALFGGIKVDGRFPVNVTGVAAKGAGITIEKTRLGFARPSNMGFDDSLYARVDSVVKEAIAAKAFPGCQVLVAKDGEVVMNASFGKADYSEASPAVTDDMIYDVASMSKATATLSGLMKAYDEGLFSIDDKVSKHIPDLNGTDKESITVKQLLVHESGMPATLPMYKIMIDEKSYEQPLTKRTPGGAYTLKIDKNMYGNRNAKLRADIASPKADGAFDVEAAKGIYVGTVTYDSIMHRIYDVPLSSSKRYRYSCLNFCLLMNMVENLTDVSFDQWVDTEVFGPLGANHTGYRPTTFYTLDKIAPTETDEFLRKQSIKGYVHDEIAAFSGGVQGNAGLFSNALDIAKLCQMWLNGGKYGGVEIMKHGTVDKFLNTHSSSGDRGLGFDMARRYDNMVEAGASERTFGHTGFTGTCFWIDPTCNLIYVFLSNRVCPSRNNAAFTQLSPRTAVLAEIYRSMK